MFRRNWKLYIEDILESINLIDEYTKNYTFDDFVKDRKTIDAVLRNLEIIGEASKHIPSEIKNKYKDIDWIGIQGLRNRITHEYFGLSYQIVWVIIKNELKIIKEKLKEVLNNA